MDTSEKMENLRLELIASLSPEERFARMNRLCAFGKLAMLEGLRNQYPNFSENELRIIMARNLWGDDFANFVEMRLKNE